MSGLTKTRRGKLEKIVVTASGIAPIDPIIELTQPGGPFPPGYAILSDGLGGWIIEQTFRPYFLGFAFSEAVPKLGEVWCRHQGVDTSKCGPVVTLSTNIIGLSASVDAGPLKTAAYVCEILLHTKGGLEPLAEIKLDLEDRKRHRRDLSVHLDAGAELAIRLRQVTGQRKSKFTCGHVLVELEN